MAHYTPILKGRAGELQALRNQSVAALRAAPPVVELTRNSKGIIDPTKLGDALRDLPYEAVIAVDPSQGEPQAIEFIQAALSKRNTGLGFDLRDYPALVPVVRVDDGQDARTAARQVAAEHGRGVCLRIGSPTRDPDPRGIEERLPRLVEELEVDVDSIDLLIDLWEVSGERDLLRSKAIALEVVRWAQGHRWRSVTLASGAFPETLTDLEEEITSFPRYDAMLWRTVIGEVGEPVRKIGFGDYAIAHPKHPEPGQGRPSPNLRYTRGDYWDIYRQKTSLEHGYEAFRVISRQVVADPGWVGEGYSWGDAMIALCASGKNGTGSATQWRAWATSHHIASVIDRLATRSVP